MEGHTEVTDRQYLMNENSANITRRPRRLLCVNTDPKTSKSIAYGDLTGILYQAPAQLAGL